MRLSSQSLFLLLFVLVARVSLAAADLERKDQPLAATPTQAPTIFNRYYARNDKSSDDGHEATIFDCSTKVIVRVPANGNKDDTSTMKQVKCRPTVVSIPASPTASVPTRSNKIETVTVTAKPKATSTHSSPHHQSSSSSAHKGDGDNKDKSGDKGSGSHNKEHSTDSSPSNGNDKDAKSSITTYSEVGDGNGNGGAAPTTGVNDPNDPTSGGNGNNNGNVDDPNGGNGDGSGSDGNDSGTTDGDNGDGSTTDGDNGNDDTTSDDGDDSTSGDGSDDEDSSENSETSTPNEDNSNGENGGTTQDPNTRSETQAVEGNVSNKSLGIGLGVGIGCVAAIGLAGLLVANKRKRENQSSTASYNDDVDTHWRPQSFMGVVASVVAKLPRSASLRSNHSKRDNAGMAVGAGQGAIEDPNATLGRHPSNSSTRSAASQPPSLARVQEHPREQMQEIDLRY